MLKSKRTLAALFLVFFLTCLGGCSSGENPGETPQIRGNIPQGTKVDDLDLSGLEPAEGKTRLMEWSKDKLAQTILLVYNETEIPFTLQELGVEIDHSKTWEQIEKHQGKAISGVLHVDPVKANEALDNKLNSFYQPAKDASYKITADKFVIQPGSDGKAVAVDSIIHQIDGRSWQELPNRINIPVMDVSPAVTDESLKALGFDSVIGEFSTNFNVKEVNRSANLQAAAKTLDRKIIMPGEVFSFNQTVGPRSVETGYKDAYVIINNEYVQGIGGGVCQVSSTLYNAVLLANLQVLERMPHAVAIAYVPLGQDATVNYPNIDFKFKNNTQSIVYIRTEMKPGLLTICLWGKKMDKEVRLVHEVEKTINFQTIWRADPSLPIGKAIQDQAGGKGYIVKNWRVIRDNQGNETEEYLGRDIYAPAKRIIRYGT